MLTEERLGVASHGGRLEERWDAGEAGGLHGAAKGICEVVDVLLGGRQVDGG